MKQELVETSASAHPGWSMSGQQIGKKVTDDSMGFVGHLCTSGLLRSWKPADFSACRVSEGDFDRFTHSLVWVLKCRMDVSGFAVIIKS